MRCRPRPGGLASRPRLTNLRHALAITSLGSRWWVDRLLMGQPVRRVVKTALLGTCAPACRFGMLSLYEAERLTTAQVQRFSSRLRKALIAWC
jgi:NAD(P)H dehydrogenase (quinone)